MSLLYSLPAVASDSTLTNVASIATIVGTVFGLPLTIYAVYYAKKAFEHQQVLGAWSLLAQKGTGDLGRKDALEFLHSKGKSLAGLDLTGAYLPNLNLKGAKLNGCNFTGAILDKASFQGANLRSAHFEGAYLSDAKFQGADLSHAHFEGAHLTGTEFRGAGLWSATFENCPTFYSNHLPTAHEGYEFIFETNEDGTKKTEVVGMLQRYYIKLIKTETKKP